jgi:tRNA-Thr(GGU) m(6)t(6)A37 methyltransferase TsaA
VEASFGFRAIGTIRSSRTALVDDAWDDERSTIDLLAPFDGRALRGLDEFSHCEVLFVLDRAEWSECNMARHPRGNDSWPEVGIFAQRAKDRPNPIGLTVCQILEVEGARLVVRGLDAVDGTPVIDIKPWVAEFGPRGAVRQPGWMTELMDRYW